MLFQTLEIRPLNNFKMGFAIGYNQMKLKLQSLPNTTIG